jgi:hypothetical protein
MRLLLCLALFTGSCFRGTYTRYLSSGSGCAKEEMVIKKMNGEPVKPWLYDGSSKHYLVSCPAKGEMKCDPGEIGFDCEPVKAPASQP